jgi:hypothetical protein
MANNINWGKIYESTAWGSGVTDNNISWGKSYADLAGGGGFDADYQAVLDYAATQGYTLPSAAQQTLQNTLVEDLKTAGVWSKLDTFAIFATDGDSDFALIDWKRLTDYTAVNSPTFTINVGFNTNGTSSYINANYNPSTSAVNYLLNDACFGTGGNLLTTSNLLGTNLARGNMRSSPSNFNGINSNNSIGNTLPFTSQTAVLWHDRNSSSFYRRMQNDVELESVAQISLQLPNIYEIMRYTFGYATTSDKFAYFFAGASLYNERTDFSNAINSYMTNI